MTAVRTFVSLAAIALIACNPQEQVPEYEACLDGLVTNRAELMTASIAALRNFYTVDSGFEDGVVLFQEMHYTAEACGADGSTLSYKVALPEALRPRAEDTHVAMIWGLDGTPWIFVMDEDDEPFVHGQNPLSAIINLNGSVSLADATALADQLAIDFPRAEVDFLEDTVEGEHGIGISFGFPIWGMEDPTLTTDALAVHDFARNSPLVNFVNLSGWGRTWEEDGPAILVEGDNIDVDCLRTLSVDLPLSTLSALPAPLGPGRHYNLEECPINGWPEECEYLSSPECVEAMAE